jgi:hypothetical protein
MHKVLSSIPQEKEREREKREKEKRSLQFIH